VPPEAQVYVAKTLALFKTKFYDFLKEAESSG